MSQQGPNSPLTCSDDSSVGTITWLNPDNAQASDNNDATATSILNAYTHYLEATNFGFNIPGNAIINGILVEIEKHSSLLNGSVVDSEVKIIQNGVIGTVNRASSSDWPSEDTYISYGGNSDLWGLSWDIGNINAANFGVALSARLLPNGALTARVDHIRITVFYSEATTTSTSSSTTSTTTTTSSSTSTTHSSSSSTSITTTSTTITTTSTSITTTSSSTTHTTSSSTSTTLTTTSSSTTSSTSSSSTTTSSSTSTSLSTITAEQPTLTRSKRVEGIIQAKSKAKT